MKSLVFCIALVIILAQIVIAQKSPCDFKVEILVDNDEFKPQDFKWRIQAANIEGHSTNITSTARIEDLSENVLKSYKPWTNDSISKQKTSNEYSPNLKPGEYKITAEISVECDDINKENNLDSKMILIKGEEGNYTVNLDDARINKSSSQDAGPTNSENYGYSEQDQIQPPQKALDKLGEYDEPENAVQLSAKDFKEQQTPPNANKIQKPQTVYESENEKIKSLTVIFLLAISILLNVVFIWKR